MGIKRRTLLLTAAGAGVVYALGPVLSAGRGRVTEEELAAMRENWKNWLPGSADVNPDLTKIELSEREWQERLSPEAFDVLREEGTERPFSSPLNDVKEEGAFVCTGCGLPLFTSAMKYDSGTGWPSFFTSIPGHLGTKKDFKMIWPRTEYHCIRCGGHQGHVFNDGPEPTGKRWCNNGVALEFLAKEG